MRRLIPAVLFGVALTLTGCSHGSVLNGANRAHGGQVQQAPPARPVSPPCVFTARGCE